MLQKSMKFDGFPIDIFPSVYGSIRQLLMNGSVARKKESRWGYGGGLVRSQTFDFLKMDQNSVNISSIWKSKGLWHTQRVGLGGSHVRLIIYFSRYFFRYYK